MILGVAVALGSGVRVAVGVCDGVSVAVSVGVALGRRVAVSVAVGGIVAVGGLGVALARRVGSGVAEAGRSVARVAAAVTDGRTFVTADATVGVAETSRTLVTVASTAVADGAGVGDAASVGAAVIVGGTVVGVAVGSCTILATVTVVACGVGAAEEVLESDKMIAKAMAKANIPIAAMATMNSFPISRCINCPSRFQVRS